MANHCEHCADGGGHDVNVENAKTVYEDRMGVDNVFVSINWLG